MANNAYNNNAATGHFDPFSGIDFKRFCFLSILTIYVQGFFLSIRTRNGPTGAPFILSTCDLLQIVAKTNEFRLIYDTWPFIQSVIVEKRIPKKGENRVLGKQVLAELRRANDFFGDFCLTTLYF